MLAKNSYRTTGIDTMRNQAFLQGTVTTEISRVNVVDLLLHIEGTVTSCAACRVNACAAHYKWQIRM